MHILNRKVKNSWSIERHLTLSNTFKVSHTKKYNSRCPSSHESLQDLLSHFISIQLHFSCQIVVFFKDKFYHAIAKNHYYYVVFFSRIEWWHAITFVKPLWQWQATNQEIDLMLWHNNEIGVAKPFHCWKNHICIVFVILIISSSLSKIQFLFDWGWSRHLIH